MSFVSPTIRITLGLVLGTLSILFVADFLGLIQNSELHQIEARKQYTETLAIQLSQAADKNDYRSIRATLKIMKKNNPAILSIGIRSKNGIILFSNPEHDKYWHPPEDGNSTATHMQLDLYKGYKFWAKLEVSYQDLKGWEFFGHSFSGFTLLVFFVSFSAFCLFFFFLKRILRQLDPNAVIPNRVKNAFDVLAEGVIILDKRANIVLVNSAFLDKTKIKYDKLIGKPINKLPFEIKDARSTREAKPWIKSIKNKKSITDQQIYFTGANGEERLFILNSAPILDDDENVKGALITFDDVTQIEKKNTQLSEMISIIKTSEKEIKEKNKELEILATRDPLTNCLNRRSFFEKFDVLVENSKENQEEFCGLMVDIDHFKNINDTYGHKTGDIAIKQTAQTLADAIEENDLICRYGGEEFCIIISNTNIEKCVQLAEKIRVQMEELVLYSHDKNEPINITVSIGAADFSSCPDNPVDIIDLADKALYVSKNTGRNKVVQWTAEVESIAQDVEYKSSGSEQIDDKNDSVTGLIARQHFVDLIQTAIEDAKETQNQFCVLILDINMFKRINSSLGHKAGDQLLIEISNRLKGCLREGDVIKRVESYENHIISRVGGDEFGIFLDGIGDATVFEKVLNRILNKLSDPFCIEDCKFHISCSSGVCFYSEEYYSADQILSHAEVAMFQAKRFGPNQYCEYSKELEYASSEVLQLENDIIQAIENEEFILHYQPKIDLKTKAIAGVEALVRWQHPKKGLVGPDQFIPLAESIGKIQDIGLWVFVAACKQIKEWEKMGISNLFVGINVSILQFNEDDLAAFFLETIEKYKVPAHSIVLEITESALIENLEVVSATLNRLRAVGIKVSIDDFGVGYSSLSYIKHLPIDYLKIDKSFTKNMVVNQEDRIIVSGVIEMSHALNLKVVAEGVETEEELSMLSNLNCDQVQGYYFYKPLHTKELTSIVLKDHDPNKSTKSA